MSTEDELEQQINRRYRWSYMIIPIPMVVGLILAVYAYTTEESHIDCYCVSAVHSQAYDKQPLQPEDFQQRQEITVEQCRIQDDELDDGDGRLQGRVRWFVCTGMSCGPGWDTILAD